MAQRFYDPARKGTLTLLETASTTPTVRRVIITSSCVVLEPNEQEFGAGRKSRPIQFVCGTATNLSKAYDIKTAPSDEAAERMTDVFEAYTTSKVIAYQAAIDFAKDRKPGFDLVHVLPGYIQGANELNEKASDLHNGSNSATMGTALGTIIDGPKLTAQVLLEDVARAHVLALDPEIAPHLTNILTVGNGGKGIPWDEMATLIQRYYAQEVKLGILSPTKGQQDWMTNFDVRSSEQALGYRFAGGAEMVKSVVDQYLQLRTM
jgi:nucleoside-diphosphate-sugar epimerase